MSNLRPLKSLLLAAAIGGLAVTHALGAGLPEFTRFPEAAGQPAAPAQSAAPQWWTLFGDPQLDSLVDRGLRDGVTVEEAAARLAQARAHLIAADGARRPTLALNANGSDQSGPLINAAGGSGGLVQAGARLSYELDILGRLSRARDIATRDIRAAEAQLRDARLLTEAEIARTYLSLRATDEDVRLLQQAAASGRQTLQIAEARRRSGYETDLGVARLHAEMAGVEADVTVAQRRRQDLLHALGFLVGDPGLEIASRVAAFEAPPVIPAGIPSEVLARRPDVIAAHEALAAAHIRLGAARTAWLPSLTLTAAGGAASPQLSDLLAQSVRSLGVDLLMALPPFDGGRRKSGIAAAQGDLDLATARYRRQVLTAFRDVDDQLSALRLLADQSARTSEAAASADRAYALSMSRRADGLASQLEVLDAQRIALRDRRADVQVRAARYLATVNLIQALGGSWETPAARLARAGD